MNTKNKFETRRFWFSKSGIDMLMKGSPAQYSAIKEEDGWFNQPVDFTFQSPTKRVEIRTDEVNELFNKLESGDLSVLNFTSQLREILFGDQK